MRPAPMEREVDKNIPAITAALDDDWVSECGVCNSPFAIRASDCDDNENPFPHGTFCPDCRARGLKAPGVLHWSKRREQTNAD
jgi:MinD superfamily P-loop ATPase